MQYELAKQLQNAGFPQKTHELSDRDIGEWPRSEAPYLWPYNPILEELIEACKRPERLISIDETPIGFEAYQQDINYELIIGTKSTGSTPTEAVARLWLALNAK